MMKSRAHSSLGRNDTPDFLAEMEIALSISREFCPSRLLTKSASGVLIIREAYLVKRYSRTASE